MGTSLIGLLPQNTYSGLIKFGDNAALSASLKAISDGAGNDTMLSISTTALQIGGATGLNWDNTNNRLGVGTNAPVNIFQVKTTTANTNASIAFGNQTSATILAITDTGSALTQLQFRASSYNFTDCVGMRIAGSGYTNVATAMLQVQGSGSTSATTSLLVQNSLGNTSLKVNDNQLVEGFSGSLVRFKLGYNGSTGQAISTRDGQFALGLIDTDQLAAIRFLTLGTGASYIDAYSEGTSKAANYPLFIGSRTNNASTLVAGSTTEENGTRVVFGSAVSDASALVQINSTTRGFLPPRMTDTQRAAIATPAEGLMLFNTTNKGVAYRDGTNWGYLSGAPQTVAASGGTVNVSFASGNIIDMTLTASTTLTLSAHVVGTYIFELTQGGSGSYTITWPASVKWSGGTAPTLTTTVGKTDIVTLFHDGTNFYGTYSLNY